MAVSAAAIAKAAATVLSNEKLRKGVGWVLVAVLSPVILIIALICSLATGSSDHNNFAVSASFYGASYSEEVPAEFRYHIEEMRTAFSLLDSAVSSANSQMDTGNGLDTIRVKAVFYALCFGEDAPSARAANRFVECFYTTETRTRTVDVVNDDGTVTTTKEEYTAVVPLSLYQAYANLEAQLGRTITEDDKSNINHIYSMIAGTAGGGSYSGEFLRGDGSSIELDISTFTDPTTKNAADLVTYANFLSVPAAHSEQRGRSYRGYPPRTNRFHGLSGLSAQAKGSRIYHRERLYGQRSSISFCHQPIAVSKLRLHLSQDTNTNYFTFAQNISQVLLHKYSVFLGDIV